VLRCSRRLIAGLPDIVALTHTDITAQPAAQKFRNECHCSRHSPSSAVYGRSCAKPGTGPGTPSGDARFVVPGDDHLADGRIVGPCTEEVNVLGVTATLGEFIWTMGREELSNFIDGAKVFACWQYLNSHSPEHPWEQPQQPQPGAPLRLPCVQFDGSQGEIDNVTGQCGPPR
jgi:hypothetical protein